MRDEVLWCCIFMHVFEHRIEIVMQAIRGELSGLLSNRSFAPIVVKGNVLLYPQTEIVRYSISFPDCTNWQKEVLEGLSNADRIIEVVRGL